jgi:hypothetical protein
MKPVLIVCEDPGETFPLLMSAYAVRTPRGIVHRATGFGKIRCRLWGLLHGYGWLEVGA